MAKKNPKSQAISLLEKETFAPHELAAVAEHDRDVRIELAKIYAKEKDILRWGKVLFPHKFPVPFCQSLHGHLVDIRHKQFTCTEAPRGSAKTTIRCFLIDIFEALEEPEHFQHYVNVQSTQDKAMAVNRSIRSEIELNQELRQIYGDMIGDRWTDQQFVLKNGVIFTSLSAGQSIRGINYRNIRPQHVNVDDLYDDEDINNPESTEKKTNWYWSSLYMAMAQTGRTSMHVTGTAINNEDLLEQLKKNPKVVTRTFKTIIDFDTKEVLWPEYKTYEKAMDQKNNMPETIWYREQQNERRDEATAIIKRPWLKDWEFDPIELRRELATGKTRFIVAVIMGNDPSIGKDKENDETATCLAIKTAWQDAKEGYEWWIMTLEGERLTLLDRITQLERIAAGQPKNEAVTHVRIEAIAGFDDYASEAIRKTNLPIERVEWVKDKISTLESHSHYFQNGKVHLNKNIDQKTKDKLIHQLTTNYPKHDDLRDAVLLTLDDNTGIWNWV